MNLALAATAAIVEEVSRAASAGMNGVGRPDVVDRYTAGLSPGRRERLSELQFSLEPGVTLLLIEHDMDVAPRVAECVTVMNNGRIVAEDAPADIRASRLVHDLYTGSRYHDE